MECIDNRSVGNPVNISTVPLFVQNVQSSERQQSSGVGGFYWAYMVTITNNTLGAIKVTDQEWCLVDERGNVSRADDMIFITNDMISKDEAMEYRGIVKLDTPSGIMVGKYQFQNEAGDDFVVNTAGISLDSLILLDRSN